MEKIKKNINHGKIILLICALFFGIISITVWALPVLKFHKNGIVVGSYLSDINGFQLAFGGTVYRYSIGPFDPTELYLCPCPLATIALVLVIIGLIICVVSFILNLKKANNKIGKVLVICSAAFLLIGGILCFFLEQSFKISYQSEELDYFKDKMLSDYNVCPYYALTTITSAFLVAFQLVHFKEEKTN